jgi:type IV pilus assembly protein PilW
MCAERHTASLNRRAQRGLSLVELMVGIVIALLVGMVAAGSAMFFGSAQKQGVGAGASLVGATTTLSAVKEDITQAGLGFFGEQRFLCHALNLSVGPTDYSTNSFVPVQVTRGGNSDQLDVIYANDVAGGANVVARTGGTATTLPVQSFVPASIGSGVLLAHPVAGRCTMRTVTANTPATPDTPQTLAFDNSGTYNQVAFSAPETYGDNDRVALVGTLAWQRYRVVGTDLVVQGMLGGGSATLVRNVVAFRVEYLLSSFGDTTVSYVPQQPSGTWASLTPVQLPQVRAMRIGLITRSPQIERRDAAGNCTATTAPLRVFDTDPVLTGLPPDWGCYRYRTARITVPLRNLALGLRPD